MVFMALRQMRTCLEVETKQGAEPSPSLLPPPQLSGLLPKRLLEPPTKLSASVSPSSTEGPS